MRNALPIFFTVFIVACSGSTITAQLGVIFPLQIGQLAKIENTQLDITIKEIIDNRCDPSISSSDPVQDPCTSGDGGITVVLNVTNGGTYDTINLVYFDSVGIAVTQSLGYQFSLMRINAPNRGGLAPALQDYTIELSVSKRMATTLEELNANKAKWASSQIYNYNLLSQSRTLIYELMANVTVVESKMTSAIDAVNTTDDYTNLEIPMFMSVDQLFQNLENAMGHDYAIYAAFHPTLGYPISTHMPDVFGGYGWGHEIIRLTSDDVTQN